MGLLSRLGLDDEKARIDWEMTPADTYGLFECRGDMHRVRSKEERYYYFYIDNWQQPARLCFMERGIRHARVLAYIDAPAEMISRCIIDQGKTYKENSYAIDAVVRQWLEEYVVDSDNSALVLPVDQESDTGPAIRLQPSAAIPVCRDSHQLRSRPMVISEAEIGRLVVQGDFFESRYNPAGFFQNTLVPGNDHRTAVDLRTNITWQLGGPDHSSIRKLRGWIEELNRTRFGGHHDWRLPTIDEVLSLLEPEKNENGLYIDNCFSATQTYVFTADRRQPGGFWLVDFGRARVYWAAGSCFSGGFGRSCRSDTGGMD